MTSRMTPYGLLIGLFLFSLIAGGGFDYLIDRSVTLENMDPIERMLIPYRIHAHKIEGAFLRCQDGETWPEPCPDLRSLISQGYIERILFPPRGYSYLHLYHSGGGGSHQVQLVKRTNFPKRGTGPALTQEFYP